MSEGSEQKIRAAFETWVSSPPYEYDVERWPDDAEKFSWPGHYKSIGVQLLWQAWQLKQILKS